VRLELYKVLKLPEPKAVSEQPNQMQAGARQAAALRETVDNLLRMQRVVADDA
jgi:hypothetical protein